LFRSVKSIHILHFPFAFLTITTFTSHDGYSIYVMNLASFSLRTSSSTALRLSSPSLLFL
jgi:hypothetical protein